MKYCQSNEEEILNRILSQVGLQNGLAVEFGGGDGFNLSNIRHLVKKGWNIVQLDINNHGNNDVFIEFITAENINNVLKKYCSKNIDILSIDIDGNDYWVWKALLDSPKIVVIEWNPNVLGSKTIKYNPNHSFNKNDYYGATWDALKKLGENKGYLLVDSNGLNMFFLRKDLLNNNILINDKKPVVARGWPHYQEGDWEDV